MMARKMSRCCQTESENLVGFCVVPYYVCCVVAWRATLALVLVRVCLVRVHESRGRFFWSLVSSCVAVLGGVGRVGRVRDEC